MHRSEITLHTPVSGPQPEVDLPKIDNQHKGDGLLYE